MLSLLFQTLLLTQTATGPAHSSEKPGMAVLDLALKGGVDKNVGDMLNELVLARLNESGRFGTVLGGSDIKDLLTLEEQKNALGCEDDSCLAQLGGALGVPYLFTSSLGTFGGKFILTLKLTSVDDAEVLARRSEIIPDEGQLLETLPVLIQAMVTEGLKPLSSQAPESPQASVAAPETQQGTEPPRQATTPSEVPKSPKIEKIPPPESKDLGTTSPANRRPAYQRPVLWLGLALLGAGTTVGIAMNSPELGDLESYGQAYQKNEVPTSIYDEDEHPESPTWQQFSQIVEARQRKNMIGTTLGGLGLAFFVYSLGWGS